MVKDKSILIKNIYYMLAYAYQTLNHKSYEKIEAENFEYIHDLFASILAKGVSKQLKQGLYCEYVVKNEELTTVRGKIDLNESIRNKISKKKVVSCEFDELTENNMLNQIIKTTLIILLKQPTVSKEHKLEIKRVLFYFNNIDQIDYRLIKWNNLVYQKNNQNYKLLINVCYFVIDGLLLSDSQGRYLMSTFLKDDKMHQLYQNFVYRYYKFHYRYLKVCAQEVKWNLDEESNDYLLPKMLTDITLSKENKKLIIDTKYYTKTLQKNYETSSQISSNLYQIFTYVKNEDKYNTGNISGMLLYAKTDEKINASNDYSMSGNKIGIRTLDLNTDFVLIKKQLDDIVLKYLN